MFKKWILFLDKFRKTEYKNMMKVCKIILEQYSEDTRQGIRRLRMNIKAIYGIQLTNSTIYRYMKL